MKFINYWSIRIYLFGFLFFHSLCYGQSPTVDIEGAVKIGNTIDPSPDAGTIRWNGTDFQGWNGLEWVTFTSDSSSSHHSSHVFGTNTVQQNCKLLSGDGDNGDQLGCAVSISGDYAIVGAYGDEDNGYNSGSAYIFVRNHLEWVEQIKLLPIDGDLENYFGYSVDIDGDYAVVGSAGDNIFGSYSGSAYIFKRDSNTWSQQAKLIPLDGAALANFGCAVSKSGDYVIIGAQGDDDNGDSSGSAYIFKRDGNNWSQQAKLLPQDGATDDYFGGSVSISGDYVIIGAYGDEDNGDSSGSADIFKRNGSNWSQQAKLLPLDGGIDDYFGGTVSISGDDVIIGAYGDDDNGGSSGSAYIFKRNGTNWSQHAKLFPRDGAKNDYFGFSVRISGNYVIIGAYGDDDNGDLSGSAYIFKRNNNSWSQYQKLVPSDGNDTDRFGRAVAIFGGNAIIGAIFDDDNGVNSGSAYIY